MMFRVCNTPALLRIMIASFNFGRAVETEPGVLAMQHTVTRNDKWNEQQNGDIRNKDQGTYSEARDSTRALKPDTQTQKLWLPPHRDIENYFLFLLRRHVNHRLFSKPLNLPLCIPNSAQHLRNCMPIYISGLPRQILPNPPRFRPLLHRPGSERYPVLSNLHIHQPRSLHIPFNVPSAVQIPPLECGGLRESFPPGRVRARLAVEMPA